MEFFDNMHRMTKYKCNITLTNSEFAHIEYFSEVENEKDIIISEIINECKLLIPNVYKFYTKNNDEVLGPDIPIIQLMRKYVINFNAGFHLIYIGLYNFAYKNKKVCIYFSPREVEHQRTSIIPKDDVNTPNDDVKVYEHEINFRLNKIKFGYYIYQPGKEICSEKEKEFEVTDMPHMLEIDLPDLNEPNEDLGENFISILRSFDISRLKEMKSEIKNDQLKALDKRLIDLKSFYSSSA